MTISKKAKITLSILIFAGILALFALCRSVQDGSQDDPDSDVRENTGQTLMLSDIFEYDDLVKLNPYDYDSKIIGTDSLDFSKKISLLGNTYVINGDTVYFLLSGLGIEWRLVPMPNAEASTFRMMSGSDFGDKEYRNINYARDSKYLFYLDKTMDGANPDNVFIKKISVINSGGYEIGPELIISEGRVYKDGQYLEGLDPKRVDVFNGNTQIIYSDDTFWFYRPDHYSCEGPRQYNGHWKKGTVEDVATQESYC